MSTVPAFTFRFSSAFSGLIGIEIAELVQSQDAQFPQAVVEHLSFIEQQFAADHFVASRGISRKLDAAHEILLLLIELPCVKLTTFFASSTSKIGSAVKSM